MFNLPMNPMNMSLMGGQNPTFPTMGPATPPIIAPTPPAAANNMQAFFNNPLTSIGMGMLAGNRGRNPFANAMAGGMRGMQQARASQQQQLRAEQLKQQMLLAQQEAEKQAEMEKKAREYIDKLAKTDPDKAEMLRMLNPEKLPKMLMDLDKMAEQQRQFGIRQGVDQQRLGLEQQRVGLAQQRLATSDDIKEYNQAKAEGFPGTFMDYVTKVKKAGATQVNVGDPLQKAVQTQLQGNVITAKQLLPRMRQLKEDITRYPKGVGGIATGRQKAAGLFGQAGEYVPLMNDVAEAIRPAIEVNDPNAPGGKRRISAQNITTQAQSLVVATKPFLADKGPLSNQDRADLEIAHAKVMSSDARDRIDALNEMIRITEKYETDATNFLRNSGGAVPSNAPPVDLSPEGQSVYQKYMGGQ